MVIDWQIVSFIVAGIINLAAIFGAYYGLKADNASLGAKLELGLLTERTARQTDQTALRSEALLKFQAAELSIRDLGARVATLETGQDEWTKNLRERTHDLSKQVQVLVLKVDRLERPAPGA